MKYPKLIERQKPQSATLQQALQDNQKKLFCFVLGQRIHICKFESCKHFTQCHQQIPTTGDFI